jgi:hypothetical protein
MYTKNKPNTLVILTAVLICISALPNANAQEMPKTLEQLGAENAAKLNASSKAKESTEPKPKAVKQPKKKPKALYPLLVKTIGGRAQLFYANSMGYYAIGDYVPPKYILKEIRANSVRLDCATAKKCSPVIVTFAKPEAY